MRSAARSHGDTAAAPGDRRRAGRAGAVVRPFGEPGPRAPGARSPPAKAPAHSRRYSGADRARREVRVLAHLHHHLEGEGVAEAVRLVDVARARASRRAPDPSTRSPSAARRRAGSGPSRPRYRAHPRRRSGRRYAPGPRQHPARSSANRRDGADADLLVLAVRTRGGHRARGATPGPGDTLTVHALDRPGAPRSPRPQVTVRADLPDVAPRTDGIRALARVPGPHLRGARPCPARRGARPATSTCVHVAFLNQYTDIVALRGLARRRRRS